MTNLSTQNSTFKTSEVALFYSTKIQNLTQIKRLHKDELLEGIHYFTNYEMTAGGKQYVTRWTLEGVYILGFFIKSAKAKEYRKKVARLLREQSEEKLKSLNNSITKLERRNKAVALGYKSQLAQQKEKYELKLKVLECELEHKSKIDYDKPSQELKKALAERVWLLMNENDFLIFGEGIASKVSEGINYIFCNTYPNQVKQLATITHHSCVKKI